VGYYPITTRNGLRCSSADAFLYPAMKQGGITLMKNTLVRRVTLEGRRATGVELVGGQSIQSRKEVILSAGAVNSPQLLQLSGIGPGALLQQQGIPVALANDNVGGNLQDHLAVTWYYKSTERTMNNDLSPWWGKMIAGMQYVLGRRGPLALSVNQCGGFVRSTPEAPRVDLQLYLTPLTYVTTQTPGKRQIVNPDPWPGFLLCHQPSRPTSRGRIDIRSPDPTAQPAIRPNYLSTQEDLDVAVAGGRLIQRMARTQAIQRVIKSPMDPDLLSLDTDESLLEDFRNRSGTVYHPVSTCRMGRDAESAVVDPQLRVFGIEGLRVADASVFPNVTSGNTNGPTIMLAHKAADSILQTS
jgi:choline dehydrogenase